MKFLKRIAIGALLVCVIGAVGGFGRWKWEVHRNEAASAIATPGGIQDRRYIPVGGIKQWIEIRSEDQKNPVLLFLHGGPGASALPISGGLYPWAKYFTLVHWDQRGACRTLRENGDSLIGAINIARMTQDGIEVAEYLRERFGKRKILLVGHSWGSNLGIHMIKARPDLFSAFVGTGQVASAKENEEYNYQHVVAQARSAHNAKAIAALESLGPPPWDRLEQLAEHRKWANRLAGRGGDYPTPRANFTTPGLSLVDYYYWFKGPRFSGEQIGVAPRTFDLRYLGLDFKVPVFFFQGTADQYTPIEPAERYFNDIQAPVKEFVRFEGDHHFVVFNRPDKFLDELRTRVIPRLNDTE